MHKPHDPIQSDYILVLARNIHLRQVLAYVTPIVNTYVNIIHRAVRQSVAEYTKPHDQTDATAAESITSTEDAARIACAP